MKHVVLRAIRIYQRFLSFDTGYPAKIGRVIGLRSAFPICRFTPSCSEYTFTAVSRYGILYGLWLGFRRIIRCHPGNPGGFDPLQ